MDALDRHRDWSLSGKKEAFIKCERSMENMPAVVALGADESGE